MKGQKGSAQICKVGRDLQPGLLYPVGLSLRIKGAVKSFPGKRHWNKEQTENSHRGAGRGITGKEGKGSSRNMYKGPRDKAKGGKDWGREVEVGGVGESGDEKMETTAHEQ